MHLKRSGQKLATFTDLTPDFKNLCSKQLSGSSKSSSSSKLFRSSKWSSSLEWRAQTLWRSVDELVDFLYSKRNVYLDVVALDDNQNRADTEKDAIDAETDAFVHRVQTLLRELRRDLRSGPPAEAEDNALTNMHSEHLSLALDMLEQHLRNAGKCYAEQKALRVDRELQHQKFYRLEVGARRSRKRESESEHHLHPSESSRRKLHNESGGQGNQSDHDADSNFGEELRRNEENGERKRDGDKIESSRDNNGLNSNISNSNLKSTAYSTMLDEEEASEPTLSADERRLLESENASLWHELVSSRDLVASMESKVVRIAELQDVFTEKVLQQKDDLEMVASNTVNATENVKDGNEEMRKAIQNQASARLYILFFLLVMSGTLLFLDWYND